MSMLRHRRTPSRLETPLVHLCFFHDPAPPEIYTLSLHDALPIWKGRVTSTGVTEPIPQWAMEATLTISVCPANSAALRSEEHTSELQSLTNLVCRLLLEKKKQLEVTYLYQDTNVVLRVDVAYTRM